MRCPYKVPAIRAPRGYDRLVIQEWPGRVRVLAETDQRVASITVDKQDWETNRVRYVERFQKDAARLLEKWRVL